MNVRKGNKCSTAPEQSTTFVFFVLFVLLCFMSAVCLIVYQGNWSVNCFFFIRYKKKVWAVTQIQTKDATVNNLESLRWRCTKSQQRACSQKFIGLTQQVKTVNEQHYRHDDCDPTVKESGLAEQLPGNCRLFKLCREIKTYCITAFP